MTTSLAGDNDGYVLLHRLMLYHVPELKAPQTPKDYLKATRRPKFPARGNIFMYQARLLLYCQIQKGFNRTYSDNELTQTFISELSADTRYTDAVKEARDQCPTDINEDVTPAYKLGMIA